MLSEFERRAWDARKSSGQHPPVMAAKAVVDQMERNELGSIKHVVCVLIEDIDGADRIHIVQSGSMSSLAVEGALLRAISIQHQGGAGFDA